MTKRALISVYDKTGIVDFARELSNRGWEIISSSGTARVLTENNLKVTEISSLTGVPPMLGGRVKTLHPSVAGGILARRELPSDMDDVRKYSLPLIDMVVCTLYPFEETAKSGAGLEDLIEKIDIGGVTLIRAAAKNYRHVIVLSDADDYKTAMDEMDSDGDVSLKTRQYLAVKAFALTSRYDCAIFSGLFAHAGCAEEDTPPGHIPMSLDLVQPLRYGENPHQAAGLYSMPLSNQAWEQLSGKPLSYNNLLDLDGAMRGMALMQQDTGAVVLKHTTPCGMALGSTLAQAYKKALACDPLSAYGCALGLTRTVDLETAREIGAHFTEILAAPDFDPDALEHLKEKRPSLRIVKWNGGRLLPWQITSTWGGILVQEDKPVPLPKEESGEWIGIPRPDLWEDLILAWKAAYLSKSNAVAIVRDGATVGIGMGFCSRLYAADFASSQAGKKAKEAVMASDGFFPFCDGLEKAAQSGVVAVIQPGGSVRDDEVRAKALELGISMFMSHWRTFRH